MLGALAWVEGGNGNRWLDTSRVVWITEFGEAAGHNTKGIPVVLAGKRGGALKTDRFIQFASGVSSTNRLFVTIMNLFGLPDTSFGVGPLATGTLPGII